MALTRDVETRSSSENRPRVVTRSRALASRPRRSPASTGYFDALPIEILLDVFKYLDLDAVGYLGVTCKAMRCKIWDWVRSKSFLRAYHYIPDNEKAFSVNPATAVSKELASQVLKDYLQPYKNYAILLKRLTLLMKVKPRIKSAAEAFRDLIAQVDHSKDMKGSNHWQKAIEVMKFALMINTFIRGWEESEYEEALDIYDKTFGIFKKLKLFFSEKPNELLRARNQENRLRLLLRSLVWEFTSNEDLNSPCAQKLFWLNTVKKHVRRYSLKRQGDLIYLLFGPTDYVHFSPHKNTSYMTPYQSMILKDLSNYVVWYYFDSNYPTNFVEGKKLFHELAQALCLYTMDQDDLEVAKFLDAMFKANHFCRINIAGLLLFCSADSLMAFLAEKIEDCDVDFVSKILMDLNIVSSRFDNNLVPEKGITNLFERICEHFVKKGVIKAFNESFWNNIQKECISVELDTDDEEMIIILRSIGSFLMDKTFRNKTKMNQSNVENHEE